VRAGATVRVVLRHAVNSAALTYIASMPLMFFVAGSLYARSIDQRPAPSVVFRRLRRLLIPYWIYAAIALTVLFALAGDEMRQHGPLNVLAFFFPVATPAGTARGNLLSFTVHLWYVRTYVWFVILGVPLLRLFRRLPMAVLGAAVAMIVLFRWGDHVGWHVTPSPLVHDLSTFVPFWLLGYAFHDGWFRRARRGVLLALTAVTATVAVTYLATNRVPLTTLNESDAMLFFLGLPWVFAAISLQQWCSRVAARDRVRPVIAWFSARALTVYLWHLVALAIIVSTIDRYDVDLGDSARRLTSTVFVVPLTVVFVLLVGWVEDIAARRRPALWPTGAGAALQVSRPLRKTTPGSSPVNAPSTTTV
jgi:fucose 4-O-acetylase-like acetyltransferase